MSLTQRKVFDPHRAAGVQVARRRFRVPFNATMVSLLKVVGLGSKRENEEALDSCRRHPRWAADKVAANPSTPLVEELEMARPSPRELMHIQRRRQTIAGSSGFQN